MICHALQDSTRLLVTHQRQFLPYCDRILVLKHGAQKALGTYSELASSALTELTQLQEEAEIDDAIYDQQLPVEQHISHPQKHGLSHPHDSGAGHSGSALSGAEAGPVQATIEAEVPTAVAAAESESATTAVSNCVEQPNQALRATEPTNQFSTSAGATTAAARPDMQSPLGVPFKQSQHQAPADELKPAQQSTTAAFMPAVVKRKKFVLPPAVDNRWGPEKSCSRLWHKVRGSGNPQTAGDDVESDAEEEQAQLNQQEGRATGE